MRRAACLLACSFAGVVAIGCGGDDDGGGSALTITKLIGPEGGTVELAGGGKVTIPAGALTETTSIKVTKLELDDVAPVPSNLEAAGKPYAFEPHGKVFMESVTIEVPFDDGDATELRPIKLDDEGDTSWTTLVGSTKNNTTKKLSIDSTSFSVILAARPDRTSGVITLPDGAIVEDAGGTGGTGGTGGGGGTGGTGGTGGNMGGEGAGLYPINGANWNDYVVNDGSSVTSATDTACNPMTDGPGYTACIHGGEIRSIPIVGQSSCTGLVIDDLMGAFNWTCLDTTDPVRAVSTGLRTGFHLSNLLDFSTASFRTNSISVLDATETEVYRSPAAVWWSNPVVVDNDGIAVGETTAGTIYLVTQNVSADYSISTSKTAFVVQPGMSITPVIGQYAALYLGDPNSSGEIDFNWIEGTINGNGGTGISGNEHRFSMLRNLHVLPPNNTGLSVYCAKSKIVDFQSTDVTGTAINFPARECTIDGAVITGSPTGIQTATIFTDSATGPNTIENVTLSGGAYAGTGQAALSINNQSAGTTLRNITVNNPYGTAIRIDTTDNTLTGITINDTGGSMVDAILLNGAGNTIDDVTIHGGSNRGIVVTGYGQSINNARLSQMSNWAIELSGYEHRVSNVSASRVGGGLRLFNTYRTRIWNVMVGNTGNPTFGGSGYGIETTFTGGTGSEIQRSDNIISNVYLVNNGLMGFFLNGSQSNVFQYLTIANSGHLNNLHSTMDPSSFGGRGIRFGSSFCKANSFNNLLLINNADSGLDVNPHITGTAIDHVTNTAFNHLAVLNNGKRSYGSVFGRDIGTGIRLGEYALDVRFFGTLLLANNGIDPAQNCHVFNDGTVKTEAGLTDSTVATTCAVVGGSTAVLDTSATSASGAFGPITTDDATNPVDVSGAAQQTAITGAEWLSFDNEARMWGPNGSVVTGDPSNWGMCPAAGGCRIYDWSLASSDTDVRAILPLPTGNDVLTHTFWAPDSATCAAVPATWNGSACVSTFLINAREIMDDAIGNENTLCETDETCLYTPNIGAYQGHGNLISAGTFTPGVVTGVTLLRHTTNGR